MLSPYLKAKELYFKLRDMNLSCSPSLSIDELEIGFSLGSSASGMILSRGKFLNKDVFIKMFPMKNNKLLIQRGNKTLIRDRITLDCNALEIGITKLFSDMLSFDEPFTQNLIFVYGTKSCKYAYKADISMSTCDIIPPQSEYLISSDGLKPQDRLMSSYNNREYDDQVNYMVVEYCNGDLEYLFDSKSRYLINGLITEIQYNEIWNSIFMQIVLTLHMLNIFFKGSFYHNDLGARNILYSLTHSTLNEYFQYNVNGKIYNVLSCGYIPKLWDFNHMYVDDEVKEILIENCDFSYLRDTDEIETDIKDKIPCFIQLCKNIISMDIFKYVSNLEVCKKIKKISTMEVDNYEFYIDLFNEYIPSEESVLLEPVFIFND